MPKSPILALYLASFKEAAGEGAVLELTLRLLAGKVPALRKYAHQQYLGNIEGAREFVAALQRERALVSWREPAS
jgi:hypothetical protein